MNITNFITLLLQIDLPIFKHNKEVAKNLFILKVVVTFAFYFHFKLFDIFLLENILFISIKHLYVVTYSLTIIMFLI